MRSSSHSLLQSSEDCLIRATEFLDMPSALEISLSLRFFWSSSIICFTLVFLNIKKTSLNCIWKIKSFMKYSLKEAVMPYQQAWLLLLYVVVALKRDNNQRLKKALPILILQTYGIKNSIRLKRKHQKSRNIREFNWIGLLIKTLKLIINGGM